MYKRIIIVALAVAAATFGAIAISQADAPSKHRRAPKVVASATSRAASTPKAVSKHRGTVKVSAVLEHQFSILRSARAASATLLPTSEAEHLTEPGTEVAGYELEPAQARSLNVDDTQAWVIPGREGLCVTIVHSGAQGAPGMNTTVCGSASLTANKGDLIVSRESSGVVVYGLVPNGDSVIVTNQDGSQSDIAVTSNFFKYSGSSAQSVSVRNANGTPVETENLKNN